MSPKPPPPESVQSGVGSATSEWILVGTITTSELGTPDRVAQLEKMRQRKTDHGEAVVAYFRSRYYKHWLFKTLTFSSFPLPLPYSRRVSAFLPTPFSPTPISLTYNCSVLFHLLMQNVTQTMWNSWNKLYKFMTYRWLYKKEILHPKIKDTYNYTPRCRST